MARYAKLLSSLALGALAYVGCFHTNCSNKPIEQALKPIKISEAHNLFTYTENSCYTPQKGSPEEVLQCQVNVRISLLESETIDKIVLNLPDEKGNLTVSYDLTKEKQVNCGENKQEHCYIGKIVHNNTLPFDVYATFVVINTKIVGTIPFISKDNPFSYSLRPSPSGETLLTLIDSSKFPAERPPLKN